MSLIPADPLKNKAFMDQLKYDVDPITSDIAQYLQSKIWMVYSKVCEDAIYVGRDYLNIQLDDKGNVYQKVDHFIGGLIAGMLTKGSTTLADGSPGTGKTSTTRAIVRMMTGSSIVNMNNIVHCDKETTKESWMGTIDPSELLAGKEDAKLKVVWAKWIVDENEVALIFDEINRAGPDLQAGMLLVMNDGRVQYSIQFNRSKPNLHVFLTMNPMDELAGTINVTPLGFAFRDRITQSFQLPQISKNGLNLIKKCRKEEQILGYDEDEAIPQIMDIAELNSAIILATKVPVDEDADRYATYLARDMNFCMHAPMFTKTSVGEMKVGGDLCKECHFNTRNTVCQKMYGGSARIYMDLIKLSKAYAFWLQLPTVTKYLIRAVATDVVSHRVVIMPNMLAKDPSSHGDRRLFVKNNYVEWCWTKLMDRKPCEDAYTRLINGNGTNSDLQTIIATAQEDLYPRIDMLPDITVCETSTLLDNLLSSPGFTYTYSCAESGYIDIMRKVRSIESSTLTANQKIEQLNKLLDTVSANGIPLDILLGQQISAVIKAINLKDHITKTKTGTLSFQKISRTPKKTK